MIKQERYTQIPDLPRTYDELLDCLSEGEKEFERGETLSWQAVREEYKSQIQSYAV